MKNKKNESSERQSKLDAWLKQTLQGGSQPAEQKIVHKSAPFKGEKPSNQSRPSKPSKRTSGRSFRGKKGSQDPRHGANQRRNQSPRPSAIQSQSPTQQRNHNYRGKLRIIPIGGLNEVGKNCMVLEYENDIIIIDLGFQFPEADLLGVDYIIPDISYLKGKEDRIRGIIFTHGHLDHIGAVSYLIPELRYPEMYGTQLTMSLVQKQLKEFGLINQSKINIINSSDTLKLGAFDISFFSVNHSIPDSVGVVVKTPAGNIVHTGDFKFDLTPSGNQRPPEFDKLSALAHQDIGALFIDSTNALKPGSTVTEQKIGESLDALVKSIEGRIIIASFASQIGRLQQIVNIAQKYDRKIMLSGRSLITNFEIASKIGYLRVPQGLVHDLYRAKKIPPEKTIVLTTGSQGEEVAALSRMSVEEHRKIKITKGDTVILSSSPIPGNERAITTVTNNLSRLGAHIINNQIMDVHASGHAQQEDIKLMMTMIKARTVVPIHGEYFMRMGCKYLATRLGYSDEQGIIIENGGIIEMENNEAKATGENVDTKYVMVDGLGVGDIGAQVIMDRQTLAENGVLVIMITIDHKTKKLKGDVDVISRGFIYMKESEALIEEIKKLTNDKYRDFMAKQGDTKRNDVKKYLRESINKLVHQKIERSPLILPILIEK